MNTHPKNTEAMKKVISLLSFLSLLMLVQCTPGNQEHNEEITEIETTQSNEASEPVAKKYKVYVAPQSERFSDASLELAAPTELKFSPGDEIEFSYNVSNFELGAQTPDASNRGIANSDKGQHIHFIDNNDPYSAHYESTFSKKLDEGHHVILSFLSRSYHESVKNGNSFVITQLTVGNPTEESGFDENAQHLFYSRPKGTYSGSDTEKLMLDFFLVNTEISENGNKVRATINGEEHILTEWAPYFIEGLEKGKLEIRLELINAQGALIPGPYNDVSRTVTLE